MDDEEKLQWLRDHALGREQLAALPRVGRVGMDKTRPPPGYEAPEVGPGWPTLYFYNDDGDHNLEAVWERAERRAAPLIAAELRCLADEIESRGRSAAYDDAAEVLRKRADELDPGEGG